MLRVLSALLACCACVLTWGISGQVVPANRAMASHALTATSPDIAYIAGGHLWIRSVDGGPARRITTPWLAAKKDGSGGTIVSNVEWADGGRRIALDDGQKRLAVINLVTNHVTVLVGRSCRTDCFAVSFRWSPNGRYLAFLVTARSGGELASLRVWDSATGKTSQLSGNIAAYVAVPEWSHDGTRIAVPTGRFDTIKNVFPRIVAFSLSGRPVSLGAGFDVSWSPDDRFVGILRPNFCGANTCDEDVVVQNSRGGTPVVLARHSSSLFDNPIWAPQPAGYAFDGWLLNALGHPLRHLVGPHERALSWRPDGTRLALQTYFPYESRPDTLFLSSTTGARRTYYTDSRNSGCGVCSKDVYGIAWSRGSTIAYSTPTYPNPKNVVVHTKLFLSSLSGGSAVQIPIAVPDFSILLGFVEGDSALIVQAGKSVYRYDVNGRKVSVIAGNLASEYNPAVLEPSAGE